MERMSTLDAGFYFMEDENTPMHVGSVSVFDGPAPSYGDLVRLLVSKLSKVPRYRQRVRTVPLHLGRPAWVDDEHFEILYHVRHTAVPKPGGDEQLRNLAGRVFAQRLDLDKPPWELWLVEGLEGGRWAVISKVHHCMIDGVAGWDLAALLLDTTPVAERLARAAPAVGVDPGHAGRGQTGPAGTRRHGQRHRAGRGHPRLPGPARRPRRADRGPDRPFAGTGVRARPRGEGRAQQPGVGGTGEPAGRRVRPGQAGGPAARADGQREGDHAGGR